MRLIAGVVLTKEHRAILSRDRWYGGYEPPYSFEIYASGDMFFTYWQTEAGEMIYVEWVNDSLRAALHEQFDLLGIQPWDWTWTDEPDWNTLYESGFP